MKKFFALLIAVAMAFSLFAFTGCDGEADNNGGQPEITAPDSTERDDNSQPENDGGEKPDTSSPDDEKGEKPAESDADRRTAVMRANYVEVTDEKVEEILENIDVKKLFSEDVKGFGMKGSYFSGYSFGTVLGTSIEGDAQFKIAVGENGLAGIGEASIELNAVLHKLKTSYSLSSVSYLDSAYAYTSVGGEYNFDLFGITHSDAVSLKAKLNWFNIFDYLFGDNSSDSSKAVKPVAKKGRIFEDGVGVEFGVGIFNILTMACDLGFKVYADTSDGIKFKLSASADTVLGIFDLLAQAVSRTFSPDKIKKAIAVNTFLFDLYFAIDANGVFERAYVEEETTATIDSSLLDSVPGFDSAPFYTTKTKSSMEIYFHNDTVTVPENIPSDNSYKDNSDGFFKFIKNTAVILGWERKSA